MIISKLDEAEILAQARTLSGVRRVRVWLKELHRPKLGGYAFNTYIPLLESLEFSDGLRDRKTTIREFNETSHRDATCAENIVRLSVLVESYSNGAWHVEDFLRPVFSRGVLTHFDRELTDAETTLKLVSQSSFSLGEQRLIDALAHAARSGEAVPDREKDLGGSCNFDTTAVKLNNWNENRVSACAKVAGCRATRIHWIGSNCWYLIAPDFAIGQGISQTNVAEAMTKSLLEDGFTAQTYLQLD